MVLINAVKDVAKALAELIGATKCAAGKAADDPSMYQLKSAAKVGDPVRPMEDSKAAVSNRHCCIIIPPGCSLLYIFLTE